LARGGVTMLIRDIEYYLDVRRATGFGLKTQERLLRNYAAFADERHEVYVTVDTAVEWAERVPAQHRRAIRLAVVTHFARFMKAQDERYEIPPDGVFARCYSRRVPYIFSESEIEGLIDRARRLPPEGSLRTHTYATLFSLLAVTGMRISEALALRLDDLTRDGLLIRKTKFKKSRIIPLHETAVSALRDYISHRLKHGGNDPHLFVSQRKKRMGYMAVHPVFRQLCDAAGIVGAPGGPRPCLHSFRHTFATRALESCVGNRDQVDRHMRALTTYLGHAHVKSTYWYLDSTPQMMRDIADAVEAFVKGDPE